MNRVHLRRRPDRKIWEIYFTLNRRRVFKSLGVTDKRIAEDLRADYESKLRRRELHLPRPVPIETAKEEYWAYQEGRRAASGLPTDKGYLSRALESFGIDDLQILRPEAVRDYLARLRKEDKAPKTVNRVREVLHTFCSWLVKGGFLTTNPITPVERYPEPAPDIRYLTKAEFLLLLAAIQESDSILFPLAATCLYAGPRRGEAIWLRAEDIDLRAGMIRIRAKRHGDDTWQPKTRRNRAVPISEHLRLILESFPPGRDGSVWAFPSPQGCRWDQDNLSRRFRKAAREAGYEVSLLDLRHTFATMLAMKGIPTWKIAKLMGNSEQMVRRHYAAFLVEEVREDVSF